MNRLFDIPDCAVEDPTGRHAFPAGGLGCGHFTLTGAGEFRRWRMEPGQPERNEPVRLSRFHLWCGQGRQASARILQTSDTEPLVFPQRHLFPFTWTRYDGLDVPVHLESLAFSPLMAGQYRESSLPVYAVVFRAHNPTDLPLEASLMLTWACGWPDQVEGATFDFQHDNLCLTGSLGDPGSPNRQGIAVPDLHYMSIYQQGIEPWDVPGGLQDIWNDFAEDGELDPSIARRTPQGAAAWVKFELDPGETKEVPFVLVWHFPEYASGLGAGQPRYYTQFLEKVRPDNAVVWLAEEVVQHYGAETANYRYWMQQIQDWQRSVLEDPRLPASAQCERMNSLVIMLAEDTVWTEDGRFVFASSAVRGGMDLAGRVDLDLLLQNWPHLARQITGRT
jgi:non-lysosomal glucosylceramidase